VQPRRQHWFLDRKSGFPFRTPALLLGFQGTKTARREGTSSPFSDAGVALRVGTQAFDEAAILTNDTDLAEPVRIVARELNLPVTLLTPVSKPATSLVQYASHVRHITPYLGPCILPDPVILANGRKVSKPADW
jgi:hypothetical protein